MFNRNPCRGCIVYEEALPTDGHCGECHVWPKVKKEMQKAAKEMAEIIEKRGSVKQ